MAELIVRDLGLRSYAAVFAAMQEFTARRDDTTADELWLLQHFPVFTQGLNGKPEHLLAPGAIPVVQVDRGGQVTYHGPGQLVVYCLLDMRRRELGVRELVTTLERCVIELVADYGIAAYGERTAPGVYVAGRKLASLGLRVRRGRCYHGLSLNVAMDLEPFSRINPCGFPGLSAVQLSELGIDFGIQKVADDLLRIMAYHLGYTPRGRLKSLPEREQESHHV